MVVPQTIFPCFALLSIIDIFAGHRFREGIDYGKLMNLCPHSQNREGAAYCCARPRFTFARTVWREKSVLAPPRASILPNEPISFSHNFQCIYIVSSHLCRLQMRLQRGLYT